MADFKVQFESGGEIHTSFGETQTVNIGEDGLSAYEVAVKNGFDGTEQEWLESLNGKSAYQYALDGGFAGSEEEFADKLAKDDGVAFKTDHTLMLQDGVLSVNTTNDMEQDNTLPITSAGVYATVGNIEALLKTI